MRPDQTIALISCIENRKFASETAKLFDAHHLFLHKNSDGFRNAVFQASIAAATRTHGKGRVTLRAPLARARARVTPHGRTAKPLSFLYFCSIFASEVPELSMRQPDTRDARAWGPPSCSCWSTFHFIQPKCLAPHPVPARWIHGFMSRLVLYFRMDLSHLVLYRFVSV